MVRQKCSGIRRSYLGLELVSIGLKNVRQSFVTYCTFRMQTMIWLRVMIDLVLLVRILSHLAFEWLWGMRFYTVPRLTILNLCRQVKSL